MCPSRSCTGRRHHLRKLSTATSSVSRSSFGNFVGHSTPRSISTETSDWPMEGALILSVSPHSTGTLYAHSTRHGLLSPGPLQHAQPVLEANLLNQRLAELPLAHSRDKIREAGS